MDLGVRHKVQVPVEHLLDLPQILRVHARVAQALFEST